MGDAKEIGRIRHVLNLARRQIDQRDPEPDLAIEYLKSIKDAVDRYPDTPEAAEYSLLLAEAFIAKHSPAAESFLRGAGEKIARLVDRSPALELRFYDRMAYFCEKVLRRRALARKNLELAKAAALNLGVGELTAHSQMRLIRLDLEIDNNPELENLMTLRRLGRQNNYTDEEQLAAWHQHLGEASSEQVSTVYARGMQKRSEQYFLDLLSSVRVKL